MMYRVVQIHENKIPKDPTLWCTTDDFEFLRKFCQYHIDSAIPEGLNSFWVFQTKDPDEKGIEELVNKWWFPDFCKTQGIRKRTFEERMRGA